MPYNVIETGTFILQLNIATVSGAETIVSSPNNGARYTAISGTPTTGVIQFLVSNGSVIQLNPGTPRNLTVGALPAGLQFTTNLKAFGQCNTAGSTTNLTGAGSQLAGVSASGFFLTSGTFINGLVLPNNLRIFDFQTLSSIFNISDSGGGGSTTADIYTDFGATGVTFRGNYQILGLPWVLSNLSRPNTTFIYPGDMVQIAGQNLDQVTSVTVGNTIVPLCLQTANFIWFIAPCPDGSAPFLCPNSVSVEVGTCQVNVEGNLQCCPPPAAVNPVLPNPNPPPPFNVPVYVVAPTLFSGTVQLGTLLMLTANFKGIYSLIRGQKHDVMISGPQNTQVSIPIPNPFFKTGLIGG